MIRAVASLAVHRLRGRATATILLVAAVGAATGVATTIAGFGFAAADRAVQAAVLAIEPGGRSLRITGYAPSNERAGELDDHALAAFAGTGDVAADAVRGVILRRVRDATTPYDLQLVGADDTATLISLADGRAPAACDGSRCEAVLLSAVAAPADLPPVVHVGTLEITIVGRGTLASSTPLSILDERGPGRPGIDTDHPTQEVEVPPAFLLVDGARAVAAAPGAGAIGRIYLWTAPLRSEVVHPWTVPHLRDRLEAARRALAASEPSLTLAFPMQAIDDQLGRAAVNGGRLLLVGSLGVAILVAFAAYAALLGRRDLRHELERLASAGGGWRAGALLVAIETAIPTLSGGFLGWLVAGLIAPIVTPLPGASATGTAVLLAGDPATIEIAVAVTAAAALAVLLGLVGSAGRDRIGGLLPGLAIAGGLIAWRLASGLDTAALAGSTDQPVLALLPAATGLAIAGLALLIVPRILRVLARAGRRFGLPVRLALLSVARDPARPAATLTLLAFGLGGLVFAVSDAATLQQGIADRAAFETGMDLRVSEAATELTLSGTVVPTARYATLGAGTQTWPVAHAEAVAGGATPVTLIGLPPDAIPKLRGWRSDASPSSPAALANAITIGGSFDIPGHDLAAGEPTLTIDVTHHGDPVDLWAVVRSPAGDAAQIKLGTAKFDDTVFSVPLPPTAVGGRLTAILVGEGRLIAGQDHPAKLAQATLTLNGLDGLVGATPIGVETSGVDLAVIRAPLATDGVVIPAIVSPDLAALAARSPGGVIPVTRSGHDLVRIRVAGVASRFPTLLEADRSFAVLALAPMLSALEGASPGAGHPDEAWIRVEDPATLPATVAALGRPPFRTASILDRAAVAAAATADPFASSILAAFAAAAVAGLLLAALGLVLGAVADLGDESGELRDLEAQGLGPRALRVQVAIRTALLAAGGVVAGLVVGVALTALITSRIGVTADVTAPIPPLVLVIPLASVAAAVAVPLLGATILGWAAAARSFRRPTRSSAVAGPRRPAVVEDPS